MKAPTRTLFFALCVSTSILLNLTATAQSTNQHTSRIADCVELQDNLQRLNCYDSIFNKGDKPSTKNGITSDKISAKVDPTVSFGKEQIKRRARGSDDDSSIDEITSNVVKLSRRSREELVVYLENEQVWAQISPRYLSIKVDDVVTVRRGRMGGYVLSTQRGGASRVKRLR